jgi:hypothetical protein
MDERERYGVSFCSLMAAAAYAEEGLADAALEALRGEAREQEQAQQDARRRPVHPEHLRVPVYGR